MAGAHLQVEALAVAYGSARVLEQVDLHVEPGTVVGLVGPNGAGKTTTLRAISGLVSRQRGTVMLDGERMDAKPQAMARAGVAHVPEGRGLLPSFTVAQNLRVASVSVGRRFGSADTDYVGSVFPAVTRLLKRRAGSLSGGEQQMVALARGLVVAPKVLMIDELSLGLAPKIVHDLLEVLRRIVRDEKLSLLLVDQNVRALSDVCDRIYVLQDGRTSESSAGEDALRAVYFGGAAG